MSMDQLETQVSDLRSFLGTAAAPQVPPQGPEVAQVVSPHDVAYSPGPLRASSHHSSLSAPGDNSAPQHQHHHPQSPPLDAHASGSSAINAHAKRRADEAEDGGPDGSAKQQRSKRNRVCRAFLAPARAVRFRVVVVWWCVCWLCVFFC
jgi:hypothetical protein